MKQYIILLSVLYSLVYADKYCTGIFFRNEAYYELNIIQDGITELRGLAALRRNFNEIYFTFTYSNGKVQSKSAYVTMNDKTFHLLPINNTNTNYGDDFNRVVYIGAVDGIYKYNPEDKSLEKLNVVDNVISISASNNELYYVNANNEVYIYKNGFSNKVTGFEAVKVKQIAVNNNGKLLFLNNDNVVGAGYINMNGIDYTAVYNLLQNMKGKSLSVDKNNVLYVCSPDSLYEYNDRKATFSKVADLPNLQGIVFGSDNRPVYGANGYIVQLIPKEVPCFGD